jgi:hypothetical protein
MAVAEALPQDRFGLLGDVEVDGRPDPKMIV